MTMADRSVSTSPHVRIQVAEVVGRHPGGCAGRSRLLGSAGIRRRCLGGQIQRAERCPNGLSRGRLGSSGRILRFDTSERWTHRIFGVLHGHLLGHRGLSVCPGLENGAGGTAGHAQACTPGQWLCCRSRSSSATRHPDVSAATCPDSTGSQPTTGAGCVRLSASATWQWANSTPARS